MGITPERGREQALEHALMLAEHTEKSEILSNFFTISKPLEILIFLLLDWNCNKEENTMEQKRLDHRKMKGYLIAFDGFRFDEGLFAEMSDLRKQGRLCFDKCMVGDRPAEFLFFETKESRDTFYEKHKEVFDKAAFLSVPDFPVHRGKNESGYLAMIGDDSDQTFTWRIRNHW